MQKESNRVINKDSIEIIKAMANHKKLCKTMFKLSPNAQKLVNALTKGRVRVHDLFDMMATHMDDECKTSGLKLMTSIETAPEDRKSYTISEEARATFNDLSKRLDVPRDVVVESALYLLLEHVQKSCMTVDEKLMRANRLREKIHKMYEIFYSDEFQDDMTVLINSGDSDFNGNDLGCCSQELENVGRIFDLQEAVDGYIHKKSAEKGDEN